MKAGRPGSRPAEIYARRRLAAIAGRWDQKAAAWDRDLEDPACHLNADDAYERFLQALRRVIALEPDLCARQGVVDAGCGTGLVLSQVLDSFAWGVGVDISPEMIRFAQARHLRRAKFVVGDCFKLPSLCPPAGAVCSRGVLLSHYGKVQGQRLLGAVRASLVPGGFCLLDFLNATARTRYQYQPQEKIFYTNAKVLAMAQQAGFIRATVIGEPARRVLLLLAETA